MTKRVDLAREDVAYRATSFQQGLDEAETRREQLRVSIVKADRVGIPRAEIVRLSGLASRTVYGWLTAAKRPMSESRGGRR